MAQAEEIISLDLLPSAEGTGRLHEQSDDEFLYLSDAKSVFHFDIKPDLRFHGSGVFDEDGKVLPATVLVLTMLAFPDRQARPIKWASVEVTFEMAETAAQPNNAPRVVNVAPGRPPLMVQCTQERQNIRRGNEGSTELKAGGGLASWTMGGKRTNEKDVEKELTYATEVRATFRPSTTRHKFSNQARWIFEGNASQGDGIVPELALAILLKRPVDGEFMCTTKVDVEVDWPESAKGWFTQYRRWGRKASWYHVNPTKPKTDGRTFEPTKFHEYMHKESIRPFWYVHMPEVYKTFHDHEVQ